MNEIQFAVLPQFAAPWIQRLASTLLHFVWQGALIGALYAGVRLLLGRSRSAEFRYLLACAALLAMAIAPLATFAWLGATATVQSVMPVVGSLASSSVSTNESWLSPITAIPWRDNATSWIVLVWFSGVLLLFARHAGAWLVASRMRSLQVRPAPREWQNRLDRLGIRLRVARPTRLLISAAVQVPTVVGWLRPLVLVPVGALTGMAPELIEGLLAHELAHIRRYDYPVNLMQGIIEAALFYHPAVWWLSNHIRMERELCCDDIAAATCGDNLIYARALAELETYRPVRLNPALAANGGSLKDRIARLLGLSGSASPLCAPAPGASGSLAIAILAAVVLFTAVRSYAQPTIVAASSLPSFEVASIRPSDPDSQLKIDFAAGGRLIVTHATLRFLIKIAYDISDDQIAGGPGWMNSARFDVQGKPAVATAGDPQTMTKDQILLFHEPIRLRLQRLLADRFQLELRKESKPMPIFALVTAKNGPKMKRDSETGDAEMTTGSGRGILTAKRADMASLARFLSEGQTGRPVVDMTGLTGKFDFRLEWTPDPSLNGPMAPNVQQPVADPGGISIFTALQQQLGLRLDPRTGTSDYVVVTRAEMPSAN
jgi:uncharacterized protein (TIGR03435 family)